MVARAAEFRKSETPCLESPEFTPTAPVALAPMLMSGLSPVPNNCSSNTLLISSSVGGGGLEKGGSASLAASGGVNNSNADLCCFGGTSGVFDTPPATARRQFFRRSPRKQRPPPLPTGTGTGTSTTTVNVANLNGTLPPAGNGSSSATCRSSSQPAPMGSGGGSARKVGHPSFPGPAACTATPRTTTPVIQSCASSKMVKRPRRGLTDVWLPAAWLSRPLKLNLPRSHVKLQINYKEGGGPLEEASPTDVPDVEMEHYDDNKEEAESGARIGNTHTRLKLSHRGIDAEWEEVCAAAAAGGESGAETAGTTTP